MQNPTEVETLATIAADIVALEGDSQELADAKKMIDEEIARKKDKIRAELGAPKRGVPAGDLTIDWVGPKRTFNTNKFSEKYPPAQNPHMYKLGVDATQVPPALKDQFMEPGKGDGTVTIR